MQLFFQENIQPPFVTLDADESKHLTRVLRKKQGDSIFLTNGKGMLFECLIMEANSSKTSLKIIKTTEVPAENFFIHLAVSPTKSPERMEWMVEKLTEIGFHELTLLESINSERNFLKIDRLLKKIIAACKQSLKLRIPHLNPTQSLQSILLSSKYDDFQKFIAFVDENHPHHLVDLATANGKYLILIGPEGDFDPKEIRDAFAAGFKAVSLGKSRLRTETAGLAAVEILQIVNR